MVLHFHASRFGVCTPSCGCRALGEQGQPRGAVQDTRSTKQDPKPAEYCSCGSWEVPAVKSPIVGEMETTTEDPSGQDETNKSVIYVTVSGVVQKYS